MATAADLRQYLNRQALYHVRPRHNAHIAVAVEVLDARRVYGSLHFLVRPVAGEGSMWVGEENVTFAS